MKRQLMHILLAFSVLLFFTATLHTHDADHDHDDCPTCLVKHLSPASLTPEPIKVCHPCFTSELQFIACTGIVTKTVSTINAARAPPHNIFSI